MARAQNPRWEFGDLRSLLIACVGRDYGDQPEARLAEIRRDRGRIGRRIRARLDMDSSHVVADIGSGPGFVAREIAPHVRHLHCLDVSPDFLAYCERELAGLENTSFHLIDYGSLPLEAASIDIAYSVAVFIHFNLYDLVLYLREIERSLTKHGLLYFDFINADTIEIDREGSFVEHLGNYRAGRKKYIFNFVHPLSLTAIENVARQVGFYVREWVFEPNSALSSALLVKDR